MISLNFVIRLQLRWELSEPDNEFTVTAICGAKTIYVFSTGQLPNVRAYDSTTSCYQEERARHNGYFERSSGWSVMPNSFFFLPLSSSLPWRIETPCWVTLQSPKPKRGWTNQSINQAYSLPWEGLKLSTRPIITSVDETTAEQLTHTKRKVPLFVFGQRLSSKVLTGGGQM